MVQEILVIISSPFSNPDKNDQCLIIYMQRAEGPPRHELIFRYLYMCIHTHYINTKMNQDLHDFQKSFSYYTLPSLIS